MEYSLAYDTASLHEPSSASPACGGAPGDQDGWSHQRLALFTFLMSAHRMPVCASMMLGDTHYLRQQLRLACTTDDEQLQQLATRMLHSLAADRVSRQANDLWCH